MHAHRPILWNQPLPYVAGLLFMDFDNVTLTSQKPCQHNNKFEWLQHSTINVIKRRCFRDILWKKKNFNYPADKTFWLIRITDFNRAEPTCYWTNFHCAISGEQNGAFWYIVLHIMLLTYTWAMIWFSNCGGLSRMQVREEHCVLCTSCLYVYHAFIPISIQ